MRTIKQLRQKKGINQSQLAKVVGVSLRTIQTYEKKDANIPKKNLSKIASYFDLSIADLYLQEVNESGETYSKRKTFIKHGCVFYPLDYGKYLVQVPLVFMQRQMKYIKSLETSRLGNSPFRAGFVIEQLEEDAYKAFEVSGDSMNDNTIEAIPNKAIVLGVQTKLTDFMSAESPLFEKSYVVVSKDRIICKKIVGCNTDKKTIRCQNLNTSPEFQDFDLPLDDVLEVFRVVKKQF